MKRTITYAALSLLLGALLNIVVAWGCAAALDVWALRPESSEWTDLLDGNWSWTTERRSVPGGMRLALRWTEHLPDAAAQMRALDSLPEDGVIKAAPKPAEALPRWVRARLPQREFALIDARGWPFLSVWCEIAGAPAAASERSASGGIALPGIRGRTALDVVVLPYRPVWHNFALNTLFYAAMLWLPIAAVALLRRHRRTRRGLCARCAYPHGGSVVCTEFGVQLPGKDAR